MMTTTQYHSCIRYFTSPSEKSGEVCCAIPGGSGNTISAAYNHAGIFGCNVAAVAGNTFHVNCLNACSTPPTATGYPIGTIFYLNGTAPTNSFPLYIQL